MNADQKDFIKQPLRKQIIMYLLALKLERYNILIDMRDALPNFADFLQRVEQFKQQHVRTNSKRQV